ncbi:MAG: GAF domain-containing protein [Anaerolineales bacterium]|nr:MAG: GAF domain-containing protein [Anaerolineales bacterium]
MTEIISQGKLSKLRGEIKALQTSLKNFADALARQQSILARLAKRISPGQDPTLQDTLASIVAVTSITHQLGQLLPQIDASLMDLGQEITSQLREHENLTALYNVSQIVNSTLDLSEVLNLTMDLIIQVTGAERGFLMLIDEEAGGLAFRVARNMDRETIAGSSFDISRSIVDKVAQEGRPILTTNAQSDPRFSAQASVVSYSLRSILCVPLRVKGKITGVIYADNRIKTGLFTEGDRRLLAAIADQAAVAIENARLFENVMRNLSEITNMKNLMDNIFASIASGVITTDIRDNITLCNPAAESILGVRADGSIGRAYQQVFPAVSRTPLPRLVEEVKRHRERYIGYEVDVDLPERGRVNLSMNLSTLRDVQDATLGVAIVVDDLTEKKRFERERAMIKRYLPSQLVDSLPDGLSELRLRGERQQITTLFADIRGFSTFSEKSNPEKVVEVINQYFALALTAVEQQEGIVDKYLGDAVMAHFNTPLRPVVGHAWRAVLAAWDFKQAIEQHLQQVPDEDKLTVGIGINTGEPVVGNVGAEDRMEYTAIGDAVNLAKRLQESARGGQILLSNPTYELVKEKVEVRALDPIQVKGRQAQEQVYELLDVWRS